MKYCEHVYRDMRTDVCPLCGKELNETDWALIHKQHRDWIDSGKAVPQGWWSI